MGINEIGRQFVIVSLLVNISLFPVDLIFNHLIQKTASRILTVFTILSRVLFCYRLSAKEQRETQGVSTFLFFNLTNPVRGS